MDFKRRNIYHAVLNVEGDKVPMVGAGGIEDDAVVGECLEVKGEGEVSPGTLRQPLKLNAAAPFASCPEHW